MGSLVIWMPAIRRLVLPVLLLCYLQLTAQQTNFGPIRHNFWEVTTPKRDATTELAKLTSKANQLHPEFGILPYNAQCSNCLELIDKRTEYTRYYIAKGTRGKEFYVQQSYTPLHIKDKLGRWITVNSKIHESQTEKGIYIADKQPVTTIYNANNKTVGITTYDGKVITYNRHIRMYVEEGKDKTIIWGNANTTDYSIGDDGVLTHNAWKDVDMEQIFALNGIETNYIIKHPLHIPNNTGNLVFEDKIPLPSGSKVIEDANGGKRMEDSSWAGSYIIVDANNRKLLTIHRSIYSDGNGIGGTGTYQLEIVNDTAILKLLIPAKVLSNPNINYPMVVDPYLSGFDSIGSFWYTGPTPPQTLGAQMGFTSSGQGCPHPMTMTIPGKCKLVDGYLDVEYRISDSLCPPGTGTIALFPDQVQYLQTPCNIFSLACKKGVPPYTGTCTTDSAKLGINGRIYFAPNTHIIDCVPAQCPDYVITFTLYNRSSSARCAEVCGFNSARGTYFALTIRGRTIEDSVTINRDTVCAGTQVKLTNYTTWGVPPYTYQWSFGSTDSLTFDNPNADSLYQCIATDQCGMTATAFTQVTTRPSPTANAGADASLCKGNTTLLGGSPTGPANDTIKWTSLPNYVLTWLSSTSAQNPTFAPPADSVGTYQYIVKVSDPLCYRYDTVKVTTVDNPKSTIMPHSPKICVGDTATLSTTKSYSSYLWSTGATSPTLTINTAGSYSVKVTDSIGCPGLSDTATATVIQPLSFNVSATPDTVINVGDNTTLGATISLVGANVASYVWSPNDGISCTTCPNPIVSPVKRQVYTLLVTSQDGCKSQDSITIIVKYPNRYWIPSAFSPNKDGINDTFNIKKESGVTVLEFKVYNRWGQLVHNSLSAWKGDVNGEDPAEMDVYVYYFSLQFSDGRKEIAKGNVTLVK